ncbi:patatin-like phospholipase family protein [Saccharicrinis sp. 156]|uniref:patatin-like phospholipase family protein n=1 Tax=Saccharicrinis sp. 156 TaxID=3417574 RepID=UPI003D354F99
MLIKSNAQENKKSLILAGGGMRLAYQAGVLIALDEQGVSFNHVDGTSGGIFNAGMLASGRNPHEIAERWRKLKMKNFMSMRPLKNYFKPLNMMGYADADGIRNKIFPALGINIEKINGFNQGDITFNVCNFSEKTIEAIPNNQAWEDHLVAGVSLPIVMPGIQIKEQWYSDAVWIKDANLMEAVNRGADELWLVWAIGNTETYLPGALNQYVHMIEMSANGGLLEEYARIDMINKQIEQGHSESGQKTPVKLFVIKPEFPLPLDPDLFFNKIDARSLINMGYVDAKTSLKSLPSDGLPMDKEATKMKNPGVRLNMRNQFHGTISNNEDESKVSFYTYMVLSAQNDGDILKIYSSVSFEVLGKEVPCFNHLVKSAKVEGEKLLELTCSFVHKNDKYMLTASWKLGSVVDWLLGLEFKYVDVSIAKADENEDRMEGRLYQDIKERADSWYSTNIRRQDGKSGGIGLKYRMGLKLMNYEI